MGFGQNLVQNGGFEDYVSCPVKMSNLNKDAAYWSAPTLGTTDYFNECSRTKLGVPMNFKGRQEPYEGSGYAGMYLYAPRDYREYIQVPLTETLQKGSRYRLTLFISLSEKSDGAVMDMGAVFAEKLLSVHTKRELSQGELLASTVQTTPIKQFPVTGYYQDKQEWMALSFDMVAKGFERYLILGNFKSNAGTNYLDNNDSLSRERASSVAQYLIDLGLDKNRITSKGFGDSKPLDTTLTDEARRKNRRVEFVMTKFEDENP